jgi:NTP pyrophosphatase (non-canonical NTP hydrolase)
MTTAGKDRDDMSETETGRLAAVAQWLNVNPDALAHALSENGFWERVDLRSQLDTYLDARGLTMDDIAYTPRSVAAEAIELVEAAAMSGPTPAIREAVAHEIADVALALAAYAARRGFVVEDCIRDKTEHDRNRNRTTKGARP